MGVLKDKVANINKDRGYMTVTLEKSCFRDWIVALFTSPQNNNCLNVISMRGSLYISRHVVIRIVLANAELSYMSFNSNCQTGFINPDQHQQIFFFELYFLALFKGIICYITLNHIYISNAMLVLTLLMLNCNWIYSKNILPR